MARDTEGAPPGARETPIKAAAAQGRARGQSAPPRAPRSVQNPSKSADYRFFSQKRGLQPHLTTRLLHSQARALRRPARCAACPLHRGGRGRASPPQTREREGGRARGLTLSTIPNYESYRWTRIQCGTLTLFPPRGLPTRARTVHSYSATSVGHRHRPECIQCACWVDCGTS